MSVVRPTGRPLALSDANAPKPSAPPATANATIFNPSPVSPANVPVTTTTTANAPTPPKPFTPLTQEQLLEQLYRALTGWGWDERTIIALAARLGSKQLKLFSDMYPALFSFDKEDLQGLKIKVEREVHPVMIERVENESLRFINAVELWISYATENDARRAHRAIVMKHPLDLVEIACTRSSEELLNTRKAYHSLFASSLEEDVASHFQDESRLLLVTLVSSYRYEHNHKVDQDIVLEEVETLGDAVKSRATKKPLQNENLVLILGTRSKNHLRATFDRYRQRFGKAIDEEFKDDTLLEATIECLSSPEKYFSKILLKALKEGADESAKEALTRVIVMRYDVDMPKIQNEFLKSHGFSLVSRIKEALHGNYADFLLALLQREAGKD